MATNNVDYTIDYNDSRFTNLANEKATQTQNINDTYSQMLNDSNSKYNDLIQSADDYAKQQQEIQQKNADLEVQTVENQKADAQKQYEKEQRASYVSYQNQINPYGSVARQLADLGLDTSGYSETAMMSMYNTYQNRVATAKDSFNNIIRDYNLEIDKIKLQNDSNLMEILYNASKTKLELALQQVTTNNELLQAQMDRQYQYDTLYENKYQNILSQMNTENALAEQVRQYNESMAYQKERDKVADAQWQKQYNLSKKSYSSSGSSGITISKTSTSSSDAYGYNSKITPENTSDYYWDYGNDGNKSNDFQPSYINDNKLSQVKGSDGKKLTAGDILSGSEISALNKQGYKVVSSNKIFTENGNYYVWSDKTNGYIPIESSYINTYNNAVKGSSTNKSTSSKSNLISSTMKGSNNTILGR